MVLFSRASRLAEVLLLLLRYSDMCSPVICVPPKTHILVVICVFPKREHISLQGVTKVRSSNFMHYNF